MNSTKTKVAVVDLNSGNLLSLQTAIEAAGCELTTVQKPDRKMLSEFDVLVMPGQGRFAYVMQQINDTGWHDFLLEWVRNGKRLVGICVGMQVLFEGSDEDPEAEGLGLFKGRCQKLQHAKTPMVGWAQLRYLKLCMAAVGSRSESEQHVCQKNNMSAAALPAQQVSRKASDNAFAYFVNSYGVKDCPFGTAKVNYGSSFCAAVQRGNLYGFQFHPEKSGQFGRELIKHVC